MPELAPPPGQQPEQPPFGTSPITAGTPNRGYEAAGLQKLGMVVKQMSELVALLGANSEAGMEVLKALPKLAKFVPPGAVTPAAERNGLEGMMLKNAQGGQQMAQMAQMAQMRQAMAAPGGGAQAPRPPAAAPGMAA